MKALLKKLILLTCPSIIKNRLYKPYSGLSIANIADSSHDAELILLSHLLKNTSVFFDIGCNKGTYAFFAEKIIPSKNLYLFEPEKVLFFQLKKIYPVANVLNIAMSDKKGKQLFKIPFVNGVLDKSLSTLEVQAKEVNETNQITYEVHTNTIDDFTELHQIAPDLIKIDVEGHELSVLNGAMVYTTKYFPNFIIEIEQRHHPNEPVETIFKKLIDIDYHCYYFSKKIIQILAYKNKTYLLNDLQYFGTKDYINNYIFIHQSKSPESWVQHINQQLKK